MLAATPAELAERRRAIARAPVLARLRDRLRAQLQPLLDRPLYLPREKALLSKDGGVCAVDGSRLLFDPFSPGRHQCPRCGAWYEGERHHRAWITRYQIWLSERSVHFALLASLEEDAAMADRAGRILSEYAGRYRQYPNRDNVLGPTRLFFSTYLESIWLCQVVTAASLLDVAGYEWPSGTRQAVQDMVAESAGLIGSFNEGFSNRQAWNNAALIGAGRWLDVGDLVSTALDGPTGLRAMLRGAVASDGLWYEGENYHFFALRGLVAGAEFLRRGAVDVFRGTPEGDVLARMLVAPLQTVLPDRTLPARSDSPYGVSLQQQRFADLWEMGRARAPDPRLDAILAALYAPETPEGPDYGLFELSEQEQNRPPQRLSRDRLGWKSLLWMPESDPVPGRWEPASTLLGEHGVAVLRRGTRYASMECGGRPGGHGHPDLLHVTLHWERPWLMDFGTGSYVAPSLHWYRSSLAHNAPAVAGLEQAGREGRCSAFAEKDGWAWCEAEANNILGEDTRVVRTLITGPDWVLDIVDVEAPASVEVALPLHLLGDFAFPTVVRRRATLPGEGLPADELIGSLSSFAVRKGAERLMVSLAARAGERYFLATAPGPPDLSFADGAPTPFLVRIASGPGRWVQLFSRTPCSLDAGKDEIAVHRGGETDVIGVHPGYSSIRTAGGEIRLAGKLPVGSSPRPERWQRPVALKGMFRLGNAHYRRSEEPYDPAFVADVAVRAAGEHLKFEIDVRKPGLVTWNPGAPDPMLDNESPDIHSDGVQVYVQHHGWEGVLLIPDADSNAVYIRPLAGLSDASKVSATWTRTSGGYAMQVLFDVGRPVARGERFNINVVINRMDAGRQRRTGQLALSGGGWVYLRGDRESPADAVTVELA